MRKSRSAGKSDLPKDSRLVVRVDLLGAKPPIWRRVELHPNLKLDEVHDVVQAAFGWQNSHLHEFVKYGPGGRTVQERFAADYGPDFGGIFPEDDGEPESNVAIGSLLRQQGDKINYIYDFGDSWEHVLKLEKVVTAEAGTVLAACTGGAMAGPPEDCGGIWGYEWMIQVSKMPDHPEYDDAMERLEWAYGGEDFNPAVFNLSYANGRVQ